MFKFKQAYQEVKGRIRSTKHIVLLIIACLLLIVSIVGTFIPLVPARLISIPPLLLLSLYSPTVYAAIQRKAQKYPRIQSFIDRIRNWLLHHIE